MPAKPLADLIDDCVAPALAAQGFAGRAIVSYWPEIVGEAHARRCRPLRIDWPRRRPGPGEDSEPATLVLRVESAFALDLQQMTPLVIEKVNRHLGWRAVGRIVLKQGPVELAGRADPKSPELAPAEREAIAAAVKPIADPELRDAMLRLGVAVRARRPVDTAS